MTRRYMFFLLVALLMCVKSVAVDAASINQSSFVKIGSIKQWIDGTGDYHANPIILVVHGGPGDVQWPYADKYRPWEKAFTVAQWDQRGAGRTFGRYRTKTPNVTLKQIVSDGIQVAEYLCRTYHKKKIIVLGHSWGTLVALNMVKQRPDLFAAFVGTGQMGSWAQTEQFQFDRLLAIARADHNAKAAKMLESVGTLNFTSARQYFGFAKNYISVMAPSDKAWLKGLRMATAASLGISRKDFQNLDDGMRFSGEHLWADLSTADLGKTVPQIDTAFFLIQGRSDVVTPTPLAVAYFKHVKAPAKKMILIDGGHFAFLTDGKQFLKALVQTVRPVAISRGA